MPLVFPRRSLNLDFVRDGQASGDNYPTELSKLDGLLTFARASTATRFNAAGLLETVAAGQPRFDFDPVTLACKGLLIEEARTNLLTRSNEFTNAVWANTFAGTGVAPTVTSGFTGPYGLSACRLQANRGASDTAADYSGIFNSLGGLANPHSSTGSLWMKSNTGSTQKVYFYIGQSYAVAIMTVTTDWQRFTLSAPAVADPADGLFIAVRGGQAPSMAQSIDILIAGAQLELGVFATSYIPTTTAQVTRAADSCYTTQLAPWYNQAAGTIILESATQTSGAASAIVAHFSDASMNNRHTLFHYNGLQYKETIVGGVAQSTLSQGAGAAGAVRRLAVRFAANNFALSADAGTPLTDVAGTVPTVTRLDLGAYHSASVHLNGHLRRVAYMPYAVSDTLLKAMST